MAERHPKISDAMRAFIAEQKIFFVATAARDGRINLSPKGMDTLRLAGPNKVVWLNLTGSGNETAAHLADDGRSTLMFSAFSGQPLILRLYGRALVHHPGESSWDGFLSLFPPIPGARQIIEMDVDLAQTSCGAGVPLYHYEGDRDQLTRWAEKKGPEGLVRYWHEKNSVSLDGRPIRIPD